MKYANEFQLDLQQWQQRFNHSAHETQEQAKRREFYN